MITTQHPVSGEDLMAFLDGELEAAQAQAISTHVDHCPDCKRAIEELNATSASLHYWSVPDAPASFDQAIMSRAGGSDSKKNLSRSTATGWFSNRRYWALGGASALVALIIFTVVSRRANHTEQMVPEQQGDALMASSASSAAPAPPPAEDRKQPGGIAGNFSIAAPARPPMGLAAGRVNTPRAHKSDLQPTVPAPMIARTVALTIQVKDLPASRAVLDSILTRYHGYAAQLTLNTAENTARAFQGSLRIPANQLASAIAELRSLGKVETESQSGEEVTQQHADLAARLQNSRETEQRLRALLAERTGRIEDVLQVEEEMARVRGEIEQMSAEQQALEHRVDFATIDLQLTEQYIASLDSPAPSVGNRMHNAFVAGIEHAGALILGIVLWFEEFGPALLIVVAIFAIPAILLLRRYRRMRQNI
jgi:anti-sigma factor RsiW